TLQTELTVEVVRDVLNQTYDLGFLEGELEELDHEQLGKVRLRDIPYSVMVNIHHPWAGSQTISLRDLAGQPFVNRLPTSRSRQWLERQFAVSGLRLRNVAELDSPGAIKYAVLNQMGISILPDYTVEREVERGEIHRLQIADLELKRPLMM